MSKSASEIKELVTENLMKSIMSSKMIIIEGAIYRVLPLKSGIEDGFKKGYAYHVKSLIDNRIYPFIHKLKNFKDLDEVTTPGIYVSKESGKYTIVYPDKKDSNMYSPSNIKKFDDDSIFENIEFFDTGIDLDTDGDVFRPRINIDDDLNNKLFKIALLLKQINFDAYKKRFNSFDRPNKKGSSKSTNLRNNSKRAIINNRSLSSAKLREYSDIFDLDIAVVLTDKDCAPNPMKTNGKPIVIYSGEPFDLTDCINIDDLDINKLYGNKGPTTEDDIDDTED